MKIADLYQSVTNAIVADLEKGVASWVKPWKTGNAGGIMPVNAATRHSYNGVNIPILWHAQITRGYPTAQWMTYRQALPLDAHVKKDEHGTTVVFTKKLTFKEKDSEEEKRISMLRTYTVFNVAQIDGLPEPEPNPPGVGDEPDKKTDKAMEFIDATKADIRIGGDRACYIPSKDFIALPPEQAFNGREHYLATAIHETIHWSGAKNRLDRDLAGRFGTRAYAAEELIAELGAAFLCAHLGITGELRHAEYIANWVELLKEDNRAIFTASSKASQAADYLRAFSEPEEAQDVGEH
jgi:antirestriction protein ArdC